MTKSDNSAAAAVVVPAPPQFDFRATVPSHGWMMLAPFRWDTDAATLHYVYQTGGGDVLRLEIRETGKGVQVAAPDCPRIDPPLAAELSAAVRRMLNIEQDLSAFYAAMRRYAEYAWLEDGRFGRILRSPSLWEDLAKVLLTTNTGWAHTVSMSQRLCVLGAAHATIANCHAFPTPRRIAGMELDELRHATNCGYRAPYLHDLARKISEGEVDLDAWRALDSAELRNAIKSLKGFGDYAARTIASMVGRFDQVAIDSGVRAMFAALHNDGDRADDKAIAAHYARYEQWRGLVLWMDSMRYWSRLG